MGKVGESGVRCGEFYVNGYRGGICLGRSDMVERNVVRGNRSRERLGKVGAKERKRIMYRVLVKGSII